MKRKTIGRVSAVGLFALLVVTSGLTRLHGQGRPEIYPNGVVHGASMTPPDFPGGHMAPGAIVSIFGRDFHFGAAISASGTPLPRQLGPMRTRVLVDGLECPLFLVSEGQINCQLPHDLVGEQVRLRIVHSGGESNEITVALRPTAMGMFAMNQNGRGPLAMSNVINDPDPRRQFQQHGPQSPARPGQFVVLWGSGLGPTDPPVPAGEATPGPAPAVRQPAVFIGDRSAVVQYAGRAPGFAGLDQINVVVPNDAAFGCTVPVRVEIDDQISNIGTMAVSRDGMPCQDPFEDIVSGLSHGSILLSSGLGRLGPGQLGPGPALGGPFPHDDDHGPGGMGPGGMGPSGQVHGPGMGFGGGVGSGPGGVGPDGVGPIGLHPGIHTHAGGMGLAMAAGLGPNVVTGRFVRLANDARTDVGIPPAASNSCNVHSQMPSENVDMFAGPVRFLDAGELTLVGPGFSTAVASRSTGSGVLYAASLPNTLKMGTYSVSGSGGVGVGPFGPVDLSVPPLLEVTTSLAAGTEISREGPLTLTWSGGRPDDLVVIQGRSFLVAPGSATRVTDPMTVRSQSFVCSTTAGTRQFAIPSYVLKRLPAGLLVLNVTHMPAQAGIARFEASGLDLGGAFRWIDTTMFLDLVLNP